MRVWLKRALLVLGWGGVAAGALGVLLHAGHWERRTLVLAATGASYLMVAAILGVLLLAAARSWRSTAVAAVVAVAALWTLVPPFVPDSRAAAGPELTVLQTNLMFGQGDAGTVVDIVRTEGVDLMTIDELTPQAVVALDAADVAAELPYRHVLPAGGGGGTGIYSRYPLADGQGFDGFLIEQVTATMQHPEVGDLQVFAFHPVPPNLNFAAWSSETRRIAEILADNPGPGIVGADFNATRDHSAFRSLLTGPWASAADQAGAGMLPTYPTDRRWGPVIGIDHILLAGAQADEVRSLTVPGSDHRAVLARIRLER